MYVNINKQESGNETKRTDGRDEQKSAKKYPIVASFKYRFIRFYFDFVEYLHLIEHVHYHVGGILMHVAGNRHINNSLEKGGNSISTQQTQSKLE